MPKLLFALLIVFGLAAAPVLADQCTLGNEVVCEMVDHHDNGNNGAGKISHAAGCCHVVHAIRIQPSVITVGLSVQSTAIPEMLANLAPPADLSPLLEPPSLA